MKGIEKYLFSWMELILFIKTIDLSVLIYIEFFIVFYLQ